MFSFNQIMSCSFSEQDRYDLKEIFRIYDFSKVEKVNDVVADAEKKGTSPTELFDSLYALYKIRKLPQREAVAKRLHMAVTTASDADVESVLRQTEMKGFSERDAVRSLERKYNIQHITNRSLQAARSNLNSTQDGSATAATADASELQRTTSQLRHVTVNESSSMSTLPGNASTNRGVRDDDGEEDEEASVIFARPPSHLSAAPTRENLDEVMAEEVREWLAKMLGDTYNSDVLAMPNFIDALRNGLLLHVLLQKMQNPPVADADLKLPKRTTGFFIRDNVATFLKEAKKRYNLVDAQLFTDSDLVDGKSDRQVVTCLMAMARIAYSAGTIKLAPNIIMYEHEIEQQGTKLTKTDLDRIVHEAEAVEDQAIPVLQQDVAEENKTAATVAAEFPQSPNEIADASSDTAAEGDVVPGQAHRDKSKKGRSSPAPAMGDAAVESDAGEATNKRVVSSPPPQDHPQEPQQQVEGTPARLQNAGSADNTSTTPAQPAERTPQKPEVSEAPLDVSPPAAADRTLSPTKPKDSRQHSATPQRGFTPPPPAAAQAEDERSPKSTPAAAAQTSPAPAAAAANKATESADSHRDSPRPGSEDLHTPDERDINPGDATDGASTMRQQNKNNDAEAENGSDDDDDTDGANGGGRVFYLRDGALRPTRPTPEEELELQEQRKKAAPRVVWKSPSSPLAATKPPLYHSRHWDGIDIALGRHLNAHYDKHPQSPWRFHMVASTSGEYVLYNRHNAQKRVVYLRIIQARLFLRNAGKNQPWVRIEEALTALENSQ